VIELKKNKVRKVIAELEEIMRESLMENIKFEPAT